MRVFIIFLCIYGGCTLGIVGIPHRTEGFGRMNAHQIYAYTGKIASFGLIDRTFADWYMLGATLEENIPPYNHYIYRTVMILSPIYLMWGIVLSSIIPRLNHFKNSRRGAIPKCAT